MSVWEKCLSIRWIFDYQGLDFYTYFIKLFRNFCLCHFRKVVITCRKVQSRDIGFGYYVGKSRSNYLLEIFVYVANRKTVHRAYKFSQRVGGSAHGERIHWNERYGHRHRRRCRYGKNVCRFDVFDRQFSIDCSR